MQEPTPTLPVPELDPRPLTMNEYFEHTPEKLELIDGYLIDEPAAPEARLGLLALLLANSGLTETVKLAPRATWLEALDRAYGPEQRPPS